RTRQTHVELAGVGSTPGSCSVRTGAPRAGHAHHLRENVPLSLAPQVADTGRVTRGRQPPRPAAQAAAALLAVLAAGALALAQGRAYWRALDRSESPLDGFAARPEPRPPRLARRVVLLILD